MAAKSPPVNEMEASPALAGSQQQGAEFAVVFLNLPVFVKPQQVPSASILAASACTQQVLPVLVFELSVRLADAPPAPRQGVGPSH